MSAAGGTVRTGCRHEGWWPEYRCWHHPIPLVGLCIEHALERLRWEWRPGPFTFRLDLSNINRPYVQVDDDRPRRWASIEFGNGNSDPVASIYFRWRKDPDDAVSTRDASQPATIIESNGTDTPSTPRRVLWTAQSGRADG